MVGGRRTQSKISTQNASRRENEDLTEKILYYNLDKIQALATIYRDNLNFIVSHLPKINWNSPAKLKLFFEEFLDIKLQNATISHIETHLVFMDHDDERYEMIVGVLAYLKLYYTLKNYIDPIIKNNGAVRLVWDSGDWLQSNHRKPSLSPEIVACELQGE